MPGVLRPTPKQPADLGLDITEPAEGVQEARKCADDLDAWCRRVGKFPLASVNAALLWEGNILLCNGLQVARVSEDSDDEWIAHFPNYAERYGSEVEARDSVEKLFGLKSAVAVG